MTRGRPPVAQLALQFPRLEPTQRPLIEAGAYAAPLSALRRWKTWPDGRLALIGERCSGRTRLLTHWAAETGAALATGPDLAGADIDAISDLAISGLAVDDADADPAGHGLLAAVNLCGRRGAPILLAGASAPATWRIEPADLRSRLQAMSIASISAPDPGDLARRLEEACVQRHLRLPEDVMAFLVSRLPLNWSGVERLADELEAVQTRTFTLRSVRPALARLGFAAD
jgi:hypothetical protein